MNLSRSLRFVAASFLSPFAALVFFSASLTLSAFADEAILGDKTGDGTVSCLAFGDSITFGIGGSVEGNGYPAELSDLVGVPVINAGVPGERLIDGGLDRLPGRVAGSDADIVIVLEGVNDAFAVTSGGAIRRGYQRAVNVIRALGREAVLGTPLPTCCDRASLEPLVSSYADIARSVATQNEISLIDFQRGWVNTCAGDPECELFNIPEGLHPNDTGYTVMAQTAAAALVGVDLFSPGGAAALEGALGLLPGTVLVKTDPAL
jgi:lysophospholipase L1-like esterase